MNWPLVLALLVAVVASAEDLWRRRISNRVTVSAFMIGVALHTALDGLAGLSSSLLGALIGFAVFLVFFLVGGMGGGDIKLMTAFGAIVGSGLVVTAAIMAALVGAVMAVTFLGYRALRRAWRSPADNETLRGSLKHSIPYAPAISLGVLLSFLSVVE